MHDETVSAIASIRGLREIVPGVMYADDSDEPARPESAEYLRGGPLYNAVQSALESSEPSGCRGRRVYGLVGL